MRLSPQLFSSTLYVWHGAAAALYRSPPTPLHSHNTLQIVLALQGSFKVFTAATGWQAYRGVVIGADVPHMLDTGTDFVLLMYVDGQHQYARAFAKQYLAHRSIAELPPPAAPLDATWIIPLLTRTQGDVLVPRLNQLLGSYVGIAPPAQNDARVVAIQQFLAQANGSWSLAQLADRVHLSPGRLRHLFKQHTGLSLQRYWVWQRTTMALQSLLQGHDVTHAAHAAGFTDASHLHRHMLQSIGMSPSALIKSQGRAHKVVLRPGPSTFQTVFYEG